MKNICPECKELILCFGDDVIDRCLRCETVFEIHDSIDSNNDIDGDRK